MLDARWRRAAGAPDAAVIGTKVALRDNARASADDEVTRPGALQAGLERPRALGASRAGARIAVRWHGADTGNPGQPRLALGVVDPRPRYFSQESGDDRLGRDQEAEYHGLGDQKRPDAADRGLHVDTGTPPPGGHPGGICQR